MEILRGLLGISVLVGLCCLFSADRRAIRWRIVVAGLLLQVLLGLIVFRTDTGAAAVEGLTAAFNRVLEFSYAGSEFVFGPLGARDAPGGAAYLAFQMLPIIIYFSAIMAVLYHLRVMPLVIWGLARVLGRLLRVSGAESMAATANVFVGMTEAPLVVRPYLERMTRSESMALMCGGFATVAGSVLGIYLRFVGEEYGSCLIAASVMSAPAALLVAKILVPESEAPETGTRAELRFDSPAHNTLDALATGVRDGLMLVLNIAAMLLVFVALVALVNWPLESWFDTTLQEVLGFVLQPVAWLLGAEWGPESRGLGSLLGLKLCVNEWIAYGDLQTKIAAAELTPRTIRIATFALCGFANLGSIGITLGGLGHLVPSRRREISQLVVRAMLGGAVASFLTATVAGMFV